MDNNIFKTNVIKTIESFFEGFGINPVSGILSKTKKASKWRYAGYPHIGDQFADQKHRVVIVGADLGVDELGIGEFKHFNTYLRFDRIDNIRDTCKKDRLPGFNKCNAHMAGTYATVIYLLKDGPTKELFERIKDSRTARIAMTKLSDRCAETDIIPFFAMTNVHKFVTVGREGRSGDENRRWVDSDKEFEFLKAELLALKPTAVVFQEPKVGNLNNNQIEDLKKALKGCTIVRLLHPSTRKKGGYQLYEDIVQKINEASTQSSL